MYYGIVHKALLVVDKVPAVCSATTRMFEVQNT